MVGTIGSASVASPSWWRAGIRASGTGGYWVSFVDQHPEYWGDNWYKTDDVYVDGYYLYNCKYPGRPEVTISISF